MSLKFLFLCNVSVGYFSFSQSLAGGGCDVSNCSLFKRKLSWPRSGPRRRRDFTLSMLGGELLSRWENSRLSADWQTTRTRVNQTRTVSYFLSKIYKTNWVINFSLSCKLSGIFSVLGKVFVTLNSNDTGLQVQQSLLEKDKKYISGIATVSSWEKKGMLISNKLSTAIQVDWQLGRGAASRRPTSRLVDWRTSGSWRRGSGSSSGAWWSSSGSTGSWSFWSSSTPA